PDGVRALAFEARADDGVKLVVRDVDERGGIRGGATYDLPQGRYGHVVWDESDGSAAFLRGDAPGCELWVLPRAGPPSRALESEEAGPTFELFARPDGGYLLLDTVIRERRECVLARVDLDRHRRGEELLRLGSLTVREAALAPGGLRLAVIATEAPHPDA